MRLQVYQAAQLLPQICPELPFKYKADDVVLFRPHPFGESAEDVRDRISRLVQQGEFHSRLSVASAGCWRGIPS